MAQIEVELMLTTDFGQAKESLAKERVFLEGIEQDYPSVAMNRLNHLTCLGEDY